MHWLPQNSALSHPCCFDVSQNNPESFFVHFRIFSSGFSLLYIPQHQVTVYNCALDYFFDWLSGSGNMYGLDIIILPLNDKEKISNIVQLLSFLLFYLILLIMTNDIHRHFSTSLKSPLFSHANFYP